ncbi:PH domain-containing protein [Nocardia amikacinitolerans]|uniref:PH domain-containing protein n=1 Tax=Nocardia amikacinitolerans TaxID=756689 RepID=UPI0020A49DD1|nr:PH domain-containing protein [Nocardia amikacinitolerans]MCP2287988.1 PH domain-containing protein [Nocardia amikacinitolerans]
MPVVRIWRRNDGAPSAEAAAEGDWDFEVRPRRAVLTARIVAAVIVAMFAVGGIWLQSGSTGVNFRLADQIAMVTIGVLIAGGVLMLTRPRVRVGPRGVSVRNILGDQLFGWEHIRGVVFLDKKSWARLELVDDDYVPLLAIRSNDKAHAARAMDRLRELGAKYTGSEESERG